jgi:hypothetical protein
MIYSLLMVYVLLWEVMEIPFEMAWVGLVEVYV